MLSPVMLLNPPNTTLSLMSSKHSIGSRYTRTNRMHSNFTHIHVQYTSIRLALLPPSVVHDSTTTFNPFPFHPITAPPFCRLIAKTCQKISPYSLHFPL